MENVENHVPAKKDYLLGTIAGFLIGLLFLPILKAANEVVYHQLFFAIIPVFTVATPVGLVVASWISRKISIIWQLAKFVVIGGLNTVVDLGVLALISGVVKKYYLIDSKDILVAALGGITFYSLYKAFSFIVANINSFIWNKYWTFKATEKKSTAEFIQFFIVSIIGFALNVIIASYVFKNVAPIGNLNTEQWELIGAAVGSIAGLAWNFLGYKFVVFKK